MAKRRAPDKAAGSRSGRAAPARPPSALGRYLAETRSPLTAAALTLPLVLVYGLGTLLLPETRNGADVLTSGLAAAFAHLGWQGWRPWAGFYLGVLLVNLGVLAWLSREARFTPRIVPPLLLECAIYAVLTGTASSWLTDSALGAARDLARPGLLPGWPLASLPPLSAGAPAPGVVAGLLISAGAGVHEELVFRLGGVGMVARAWLGKSWRSHGVQVAALSLVAALVFSAAHHLTEPFTLSAFVFRTVAGLLFTALYLGRGFAVAAWTHALYDAWILVLLRP